MKQHKSSVAQIEREFNNLNLRYVNELGISKADLYNICFKTKYNTKRGFVLATLVTLFCILYQLNSLNSIINYFLGVRCIIPNNYLIWEATRPVADCRYCLNVSTPIILNNVTRNDFKPYAYTSKPIVIKQAFLHWAAIHLFNFTFFANLYNRYEDAFRSVDEECQFLHFKSNFISFRDVFEMDEARIENKPGQLSWYIGWYVLVCSNVQ